MESSTANVLAGILLLLQASDGSSEGPISIRSWWMFFRGYNWSIDSISTGRTGVSLQLDGRFKFRTNRFDISIPLRGPLTVTCCRQDIFFNVQQNSTSTDSCQIHVIFVIILKGFGRQ